ncbi:hypothetical protein PVAND_002850 [Polypedilum vanderplanki]|uniref:Uncharacterized protein n=1 Tax=Polypedilum vanderplanki TaxID=319348 RepID=A0A9J6BS95_POLVA|nr:hypothetical protein PVAND_002850 [Polypedilum vanderplanki]
MDSLRSLTSSSHERSAAAALHGKGKLLRDSNVTVIQVLPRERINRRANKITRRRVELPTSRASDLEVLTLTPLAREQTDGKLMKLHIINVRTGKIQDAIMLTTSNNDAVARPKSDNVSDSSDKKKEIIRVQALQQQQQQHSNNNKPESTWNEIKVNSGKNRYPPKPYKLRNKFTSSKCKCEDTSRIVN